MATEEHYREHARRCRQLAADHPLSKHVKRWRSLADSYDLVIDRMQERRSAGRPAPMPRPPVPLQA